MSSGAGRLPRPTPPPEWAQLERAVRALLDELDALRGRAAEAERRMVELEATVREVSKGRLNPAALSSNLEALQSENAALRMRLEQAQAGIARVVARLQFLEDRR